MSLRSLSDQQVLSGIQELTRRERKITLHVLLHLNEIERRCLHLKLGYSSMFDYCTSRLGYSASAASRRIRTARCVARFPEVYDLLEANDVNVSTIAQVSRVLSSENKDALLARIRAKSQREVEAIVAEFEPHTVVPRDRVRLIAVASPAPIVPATIAATPVPMCTSADNHDRSGCDPDTPAARPAYPAGRDGEAEIEHRAMIQFCASHAFMAKLEKIKTLAWHRLPANASLEQVFELAMDAFIEREDPAARQERREKRVKRAEAQKPEDARPQAARRKPTRPETSKHGARYISAPVRDEVFVRDKGRCVFVGTDGKRCASTHALQVDHVHPVARGGRGTVENLRLLCACHNRLEAERLLGVVAGAGERAGARPLRL